jgi:hypothetical protein
MRILLLIGLTIVMAGGQTRQEEEPRERKLPDGRSQTESPESKKSLGTRSKWRLKLKGELEKTTATSCRYRR